MTGNRISVSLGLHRLPLWVGESEEQMSIVLCVTADDIDEALPSTLAPGANRGSTRIQKGRDQIEPDDTSAKTDTDEEVCNTDGN